MHLRLRELLPVAATAIIGISAGVAAGCAGGDRGQPARRDSASVLIVEHRALDTVTPLPRQCDPPPHRAGGWVHLGVRAQGRERRGLMIETAATGHKV
jgi:hypothetical protein